MQIGMQFMPIMSQLCQRISSWLAEFVVSVGKMDGISVINCEANSSGVWFDDLKFIYKLIIYNTELVICRAGGRYSKSNAVMQAGRKMIKSSNLANGFPSHSHFPQ